MEAQPTTKKQKRKIGRWVAGFVIAVILLLIAGELFARFYIGLGDPPLSVADPQIEYMFKPNQECLRFGHRIHYNAYSMRSDDFPPHKSSPDELRVMVFGDSVINGGAPTDQSQLATTILQSRLTKDLGRKVIVGNISAGSWGPPNEYAYAQRFGLFDADVVVIELASHDYADAPTFDPVVGIDPNFPDRKPFSALWEGLTRYLPAYIKHESTEPQSPTPPPSPATIKWCSDSERDLIRLAKTDHASVFLAQHLERGELDGHEKIGHDVNLKVAEAEGIPVVQMGPAFAEAVHHGEQVYRDGIHPSAAGQRVMADVLEPEIKQLLNERAEHATSQPVSIH